MKREVVLIALGLFLMVFMTEIIGISANVIYQEDFEHGWNGWQTENANITSWWYGKVTDAGVTDLLTVDKYTFNRSCPGDFSNCTSDNKNHFAYLHQRGKYGPPIIYYVNLSTQGFKNITLSLETRGIIIDSNANIIASLVYRGDEKDNWTITNNGIFPVIYNNWTLLSKGRVHELDNKKFIQVGYKSMSNVDCGLFDCPEYIFLFDDFIVNGDPICSSDSDCGTNRFTGGLFCQNNNIFQNLITYTCNYPNTSQSYCSNTTIMNMIQDCGDSYCDNFGDNYCKNGNVFHNQTCYDKGCSNSTCYNNQFTKEDLIKHCDSEFCENGVCTIPISNFTPIIFNPKEGQIFNSRKVFINVSVKKQVKVIKYQLDGKKSMNGKDVYIDLCKGKCLKVEKNILVLDGNHTLGIVTINEDNRQFEASVKFLVDSTKPQITKTLPSRNKIANGTFYVEFNEQNPKNITLSYGTINNKKIIDLDITKCSKNKNKIYCSIDINLNDYKDQKINYSFKIIDIANNLDENKPLVVKV